MLPFRAEQVTGPSGHEYRGITKRGLLRSWLPHHREQSRSPPWSAGCSRVSSTATVLGHGPARGWRSGTVTARRRLLDCHQRESRGPTKASAAGVTPGLAHEHERPRRRRPLPQDHGGARPRRRSGRWTCCRLSRCATGCGSRPGFASAPAPRSLDRRRATRSGSATEHARDGLFASRPRVLEVELADRLIHALQTFGSQ